MTIDEAKKAIAMLKQSGLSDEQIAKSFALMFINDEIDIHILEALMHVLGYELDADFLKLDTKAQKMSIKRIYGIR